MHPHFWRHCAAWGLTVVVLTTEGCQSLQMLNRGPAPSNDPFFSIRDQTPRSSQSSSEAMADHEDPITNQSG